MDKWPAAARHHTVAAAGHLPTATDAGSCSYTTPGGTTDHPGLWEVRCNVSDRGIARVFFTVSGRTMVLLHGFIKKSQATPRKELALAQRRMKEHDRHV